MAGSAPGPGRANDQKPETSGWRPIWVGLAAAMAVALTLFAAFALALQDLPADFEPPPTSVDGESTPLSDRPTPETPTATPVPGDTPGPYSTMIPTVVVPGLFTPTPTRLAPVALPTATPTFLPTTTPACTPPAGWVAYQVRTGDSLETLARRHGVSAAYLMQANCLSSPAIYPGQVVFVPATVVAPTATPPTCGPPSHWVRYTVQPGDTLYSLAARTNTSVQALADANCLASYTIYAGQQIWLPFLPPPPPTPTFTRPLPATATPTTTATQGIDTPTPTASPTPTATPTATPTPTATTAPPTDTPTLEPPTATPTPTLEPPTATHTPPTNTPVVFSTPAGS